MKNLKKPISELTPEDLKELVKPLGTKGRPYPMRDMVMEQDASGEKTLVNRLSVIEDNRKPLKVYSDRSYTEVVGMAMREMPTPGMLPIFFDAIQRRDPANKRRIQFMKGAAGAGKTYMAEFVARMRDDRGAIKVDCSNMNLGELLFETVIDFGGDQDFPKELNKRLENGSVNEFCMNLLKEGLGKAFIDQGDGRATIDWDKIGKQNIKLKDKGKDGEPEFLEREKAVQKAIESINKVNDVLKIDLSGNALGMATQKGPLIIAYEEGREIILDEFNRAKKGTTGVLHGVLQFIIGETDTCTATNTLKEKGDEANQSYVFDRNDMKGGFFVSLTGNTESDGTDVEELPQSLNSRIVPQHIPIATEEDWQHRICQILTGIPVSTLYHSKQEQWDQDPDGFRKMLTQWRSMGESKDVPEQHRRLLQRWEKVVKASEKLAKFYYGWSQIVDPNSMLHQAGSLAELLDEVDETYNAEVTVDFRKIIAHINEALEIRPQVVKSEESGGYDVADWDLPPELEDQDFEEDPLASFGTRLSRVIIKQIVSDTQERGKMGLYRDLMNHAKDCGLIDPGFHEALRSEAESIAALLDDNPFESQVWDVRVELVRDIVCDYLRAKYPEIEVEDNEQILTTSTIDRVLKEITDAGADVEQAPELDGDTPEGEVSAEQEVSSPLIYLNGDADTLSGRPLLAAQLSDVAATPEDQDVMWPATEQLVDVQDFLPTLAAPEIRAVNLKAAWNKALSNSGVVLSGQDSIMDESLGVAENTSDNGIAATTLVMKRVAESGQVEECPMHLIWNQKKDALVIIADGQISSALSYAFSNSRVCYVNRESATAEQDLNTALANVLGAEREQAEPVIKNALLLRAEAPSGGADLGGLLLQRDVEQVVPKYVLAA